ncbi:unnamed protein product [Peniophora sp. CBMAI 1063]|nr:unnamed protein product [Peniophora sp. CBMAI 1063]
MTTEFAVPNGPWISKTDAYSRYGLGSTDLDSIKPISIEPNSRAYGNIIKYNLCDVEQVHAKVVELRKTLQQGLPAGDTVPKRGATITRTNAKKEYNLNDNQIDRILPCIVKPNPHAPGQQMRIYNVSDVRALRDGIASLSSTPAPAAAAPQQQYPSTSSRGRNSGYYNDRNRFDGMSADDAAADMAGIFKWAGH